MEKKAKSPVPSDSETEKQQQQVEIEKPIEKYSKIMTSSHPASGLSLLAESAVSSRLPLTADRPNMREQLLAKAVEKKQVRKKHRANKCIFFLKEYISCIK